MPLRVYYNEGSGPAEACTIRPTPLVSINTNPLKNGAGDIFGVTYEITLNGTLLADQGTPYGIRVDGSRYPFDANDAPTPNSIGPYGAFDNNRSHFENNKPPRQFISNIEASNSIFSKQKALRALFLKEGLKLEITDFNDDEATIICYPRFGSISFQEGIYVDTCDYTISLEADVLLNKDSKIDHEGTLIPTASGNIIIPNITENILTGPQFSGVFISDFSEDWSLETDESLGESPEVPRSYRISHSINAVGKKHYSENGFKPAWVQAKQFVQSRVYDTIDKYPNIMGKIGSGLLNLVQSYGGYNHVRSEQLSESAGTYSVTETWLLASGNAYENFNISLSSSIDNPFVSVSIDGSIRGLTTIPASGYDKPKDQNTISAFDNALKKYNKVSNSGQFGLTSDIYKRANNLVAVQLNSQPRSISVTTNQYAGEIGYSLQFDNRPTNIISGVLTENISVNDTYPGDIFAVIPVLGRKTGPVLQYIGGRTEYKRDVQINLIMDYTKIPYESGRNNLLLRKPSIAEPTATQLFNLITQLSPANEPGVRKYFVFPPTENWNPKEGAYSLSLSWTYELDS